MKQMTQMTEWDSSGRIPQQQIEHSVESWRFSLVPLKGHVQFIFKSFRTVLMIVSVSHFRPR